MYHSASTATKAALRHEIKALLRGLSEEYIQASSEECMRRLVNSAAYQRSRGICCYLSMGPEVQTYEFIRNAFLDGKNIFIPKVIGPKPSDMIVVKLDSFDTIASFPKSKWGIPEPTAEYLSSHPDVASDAEALDLVVVPGVAFDATGARLGHGKGYYDSFLGKVDRAKAAANAPRVATIGVGFNEQIVDCIPMNSNDRHLDCILTSSRHYGESL